MFFDGSHGDVVTAHGRCKIPDHHRQWFHLFGIVIFRCNDLLDFHGVFRDGSRLIHTEHVDPCQRFNAFHIVQQDFFLGQADGAYGQSHACEKVQPFGDHADDSSHHGGDAGAKRLMLEEKCLYEQHKANGDNGDAHEFYQLIQGAYHL